MNAQVEVRQPDGQYQSATILKLTDQSTYTVGEYDHPPICLGFSLMLPTFISSRLYTLYSGHLQSLSLLNKLGKNVHVGGQCYDSTVTCAHHVKITFPGCSHLQLIAYTSESVQLCSY